MSITLKTGVIGSFLLLVMHLGLVHLRIDEILSGSMILSFLTGSKFLIIFIVAFGAIIHQPCKFGSQVAITVAHLQCPKHKERHYKCILFNPCNSHVNLSIMSPIL